MRGISNAAHLIGAPRLVVSLSLLAAFAHAAPSPLDRRVSALPGGVELRDRADSLALAGWGQVLLDRRVDPHWLLAGAGPGRLGDSLNATLAAHGGAVSDLGGVLYIGPADSAANLRTLAAMAEGRLSRLDAGSRAAMRRVDSLSWPRLTEPRELIESLLAGHGLRITNPDRLPHDVWPAGRLPAMSLSDRLTLLLVGFDLTWAPAGERGAIELAPAPPQPTLTKSYRIASRANWSAEDFRAAFPDARVERRGSSLELTGRVEAHDHLQTVLRGGRKAADSPGPRSESPGEQRLTLSVRSQPARAVLEKVAGALSFRIDYDPAHSAEVLGALAKRIDVSVSQATPGELLEQIAAQSGVAIKVEENVVRVTLADE
ncbi:hypothetical protein Pla123a_39530 [Posidoniimonas polymericola]|uniref:Bacterial type II/III secretion system short domain protein n=1 Tax=Posidoniimonas polymericola TaxID=2528002 RepID=A0A5C5YGR2_9BACT|nr:hypothetical protein [Posidoniimonas polymericola]TWT73615.1 hypothetical protein Pla123a_39530 [Posidoniimonas polymericola]